MSRNPSYAEQLRKAFEPGARGVVGVVDELLALCREDMFRLEWKDGGCECFFSDEATAAAHGSLWAAVRGWFGAPRSIPVDPGVVSPKVFRSVLIPLPKSVFRALLARLAALCNERKPNSVSPYGGTGEVVIEGAPPKVIRVWFTNTPAEQSAILWPKSEARALVSQLGAPATPQAVT